MNVDRIDGTRTAADCAGATSDRSAAISAGGVTLPSGSSVGSIQLTRAVSACNPMETVPATASSAGNSQTGVQDNCLAAAHRIASGMATRAAMTYVRAVAAIQRAARA